MSEVSKSGKGIVNYFKTNEALVPRSFRRSMTEVVRLAKSVGVILVWSIVSLMAYFAYSPSSLPISFEKEIGKLVSCQMETVGNADRLVITLNQGEIQKKYALLNEIWINTEEVSDVADEAMTKEFNKIKNATQAAEALDVDPQIDESVRVFSIMPSLK